MIKQECLICIDLHKKIREKIRGRIFVAVRDDVLTVYINSGKNVKYVFNINNVSEKMSENRLTADSIANKVVYDYKKFILKKFMY